MAAILEIEQTLIILYTIFSLDLFQDRKIEAQLRSYSRLPATSFNPLAEVDITATVY